MKLGFSSQGCPDWDLDTLIAQAAAMGYQGIELYGLQGERHLPAVPALRQDPKAVGSRFRDAGVELVCLATGNTFHWPDRRRLEENKQQVREFIELAGELGCRYVRVLAGELPRHEDRTTTLLRIADALRELGGIAAGHGTTILLENHGDFAGSRDLWFVLDMVSHPAVRACWHPCHAQVAGDRPSLAIPRLGRRIALAHIVDGRFTTNGAFETYVLPGEGQVDLELTLTLLRGVGYEGYLIFDWPRQRVASLAGPEQALPAALAQMKALLEKLESVKELSAYKGDKNAPRYSKPSPT
ncbi:MAG TPA: sugar phosphate isomerase/epimerase family protein [Phycisphaerae bacterium]|jgi:sugar phosphate isomerase/epimerase|nr:TIM barrel protein [Phycisphaerae bacterium]HOB76800.1 sugar phosphate isomerase/epimerase family protein [Phycisphaerae bacterium]HOJ56847.1 sugar phosphate isomerase/epimerase family protein [Phycisphaerae bacterium]HOL28567.1 sugar phosphate isomerase/epimerase family protein [Phycisphaerae bacterium]HPP23090.1 sugar phosphate isomerase/epimerase family protein [Phycisphaerae bacterium]